MSSGDMVQKKKNGRIAFVCPRYGMDIVGGSEQYCRQVAEKLSGFYEVHVYTTCAVDALTFKNVLSPGEEMLNGVLVKRFRNKKERDVRKESQYGDVIFHNYIHSDRVEEQRLEERGPYCPELLEALRREQKQYKAVFFMTYEFYTTVKGVLLDNRNTVLIPTLHDDEQTYMRCYREAFAKAPAFIWLTESEKQLALRRFPFVEGKPGAVAGMGIEKPAGELDGALPDGISEEKYLIYAGRISPHKGCSRLIDYFQRYIRETKDDIKLVLIGQSMMDLPEDPNILYLGRVSEEMKFRLFSKALAMAQFSPYESLSIVVLECMGMGRPIIVTDECDVLKEHCERSSGGFYFSDYEEFRAELSFLRNRGEEYRQMCRNARDYVRDDYNWDLVIRQFRGVIENDETVKRPNRAVQRDENPENGGFSAVKMMRQLKETVKTEERTDRLERIEQAEQRLPDQIYSLVGDNVVDPSGVQLSGSPIRRGILKAVRKLSNPIVIPMAGRITETNYDLKKALIHLAEVVESQQKEIARQRRTIEDLQRILIEKSIAEENQGRMEYDAQGKD